MGTVVRISTELLTQIVTDVQRSTDEECGLLFGTVDTILAIEPCANVAAEPRRRFEIDPARLLAAHRLARAGGPAVIGHYHSHPTGIARPSACDAAGAAPDGTLWLIVAGVEVTAWRALANGPVEGRFVPVTLRVVGGAATTVADNER